MHEYIYLPQSPPPTLSLPTSALLGYSHVCTYIYMYIPIRICICICIYIHIRVYIRISIYIHAQILPNHSLSYQLSVYTHYIQTCRQYMHTYITRSYAYLHTCMHTWKYVPFPATYSFLLCYHSCLSPRRKHNRTAGIPERTDARWWRTVTRHNGAGRCLSCAGPAHATTVLAQPLDRLRSFVRSQRDRKV